MAATATRTDRLLLLEVGMVLALFGLATLLYMRPAAEAMTSIEWWNWLILGALFFGIVALHTRRRRYRGRAAIQDVIRDDESLPKAD